MKIFKFGGASVKDAEGVKNVAKVLQSQGFQNCLLVVSAMGKTTNALEKVVNHYFKGNAVEDHVSDIKKFHLNIVQNIFPSGDVITADIEQFFEDLLAFLRRNKSPNYDYVYDQVVSCGEMISSKILSHYLQQSGFPHQWLDARHYIKTNDHYREGQVNWQKTEKNIRTLSVTSSYVTQGFIGSDDNNFTTTLGREGSDYSAAIFAYCLDAENMTIWKDVPGVMTGDPRKFDHVNLLSNISYEEAIEMAYYGASVIHPKTLQPLKQKHIPFFVKSFLEPEKDGTMISKSDSNQYLESYILKEDQMLMRISTRDFSFIAENHISHIFNLLDQFNIKVSLMQNSAISLALCLEDKYGNMERLRQQLETEFNVELRAGLSLFTVRNADMKDLSRFFENKKILLEQVSKNAIQMVTES